MEHACCDKHIIIHSLVWSSYGERSVKDAHDVRVVMAAFLIAEPFLDNISKALPIKSVAEFWMHNHRKVAYDNKYYDLQSHLGKFINKIPWIIKKEVLNARYCKD
jgi:hypothetical protein